MDDNLEKDNEPYYDPEWLKEYVRQNKDSGSKIVEIYMEGYEDGKREAKEAFIKEMNKRKSP